MRDIAPSTPEGPTVYLLGAGASFGAAVADAPPVMTKFVETGRRMVAGIYNSDIRINYDRLWQLLERLGFPLAEVVKGRPDLEEIYVMLSVISRGLWFPSRDAFLSEVGEAFRFVPPLALLKGFIVDVVTTASLNAKSSPCDLHNRLFHQLATGDTVISFNYDLIADYSMRATHRWCEVDGYGFHDYVLADQLKPATLSTEFLLLKPHGSLNWYTPSPYVDPNSDRTMFQAWRQQASGSRMGAEHRIRAISLNQWPKPDEQRRPAATTAWFHDELAKGVGKEDFWKIDEFVATEEATYIIPPTLEKMSGLRVSEELAMVWSKAREALAKARRVICVGYSFQAHDIEFFTLLRLTMASRQSAGLLIEVVNPDSTVVRRIRDLLPHAETRHVANNLREYVS